MACRVLLMPENDRVWVHRNYVYLPVKETDWVVSNHNIFGRYLISIQIFTNVMKTADHVHIIKYVV